MTREEKLELMAGAKERAKARTAAWLAQPKIQESFAASEKAIEEMKQASEPRKRA